MNEFLAERKRTLFTALLFTLVFSLLYHFLVEHKALVRLHLQTDARTIFKIYWKKDGGNWTERRVASIVIDPKQQDYAFRLADLGRIAALRIDTSERPANVTLKSLDISQNGFAPIRLSSGEDFSRLQIIEGVDRVETSVNGLTVVPAGRDPQLLLEVPPLARSSIVGGECIRIGCIALLVFFLCFALRHAMGEYRFISYLMLMAFVLILAMASLSEFNQHPDEPVHVRAGEYFQDHILPPPVGDPAIVDSYSGYGVSRLHSGEIAYLFAGKFAKLLQPFNIPAFLSLRFFNVGLFFLLFLLTLNSYHFRLLMVPVLLSPQIWYIFSYVNSEAFAVFIMLVVAYQMVCPHAAFHRLMRAENCHWRFWGDLIGLGLLFGILLLLKLNFFFFVLFLGLYLIWRAVFGTLAINRSSLLRMAAVLLIGATLFAGVRGVDSYINDFKKSEKLLEAREQLALDMYKPSTPLEKKHIYLHMKDRGITLQRLLTVERWGEKSFRSAFGVYGYTSIPGSFNYYDYVRYTGIALCLAVIAVILWRGGWEGVSLLSVTLASGLALIALAIYHAWTMDFQPQGRYFLPLVGMLAVFFAHVERHLARPSVLLLFTGMFLLACYNFLFTGLRGVEKFGFLLV